MDAARVTPKFVSGNAPKAKHVPLGELRQKLDKGGLGGVLSEKFSLSAPDDSKGYGKTSFAEAKALVAEGKQLVAEHKELDGQVGDKNPEQGKVKTDSTQADFTASRWSLDSLDDSGREISTWEDSFGRTHTAQRKDGLATEVIVDNNSGTLTILDGPLLGDIDSSFESVASRHAEAFDRKNGNNGWRDQTGIGAFL